MSNYELRIEVEVTSETVKDIGVALFGVERWDEGFQRSTREGVLVTAETGTTLGLEPMTVIAAVVGFASSMATNIVASWLYDAIKGRASKIYIEGEEIEAKLDRIEAMINEIRSSQEKSK